jgi:DNA-binding response OmpR family regulator
MELSRPSGGGIGVARLLVVDDDADLRDLTAQWLRVDGHEVLTAGNAAAALSAVRLHGSPQVAVLDVDMPGMDGVQLLQALRERDPGLPGLFLTVLWSAAHVARMHDVGGVYVRKPYTAEGLRTAVRRLLSGTRPSGAGG